jgi:coproporphyrinogen III oxidase-like Fe-S oxidoreductase
VDLIYGYVGQTAQTWKQSLEKAISFQPEHLSCYQLTFEEKTLFNRWKQKGIVNPLMEKEEAALFVTTSNFLQDLGYIHYEISNFAREEKYASRHNRKYWHHVPYLGLGPSAHSYQNATRWWNVRSIRAYCKALESGRAPVENQERLTDAQLELETVSLGSRTMEGFDLNEITQTPLTAKNLSTLRDAGFIRVKDGHVLPTLKGFLVADQLPLFLA